MLTLGFQKLHSKVMALPRLTHKSRVMTNVRPGKNPDNESAEKCSPHRAAKAESKTAEEGFVFYTLNLCVLYFSPCNVPPYIVKNVMI